MMLRLILWKEYREQRSTWLALAVVAAAAILGVGIGWGTHSTQDEPAREILFGIAGIMAWTYGMVCGALLLAGEAEAGTQPFLDSMPVGRMSVWRHKVLAGGLFVLAQVAVIAALCIGIGLNDTVGWLVLTTALLLPALSGFGWGTLFSASSKTPLAAIALAVAGQFAALPPLILLGTAVVRVTVWVVAQVDVPIVSTGVGVALAALLPLPLSALVYSSVDRGRRLPARRPSGHLLAGAARQSLWLAWSQTRGVALVMTAMALLGGAFAILNFSILWPAVSLLLGVACGATFFLDEQDGPSRFLGDQRLPLTPLWLAKLAVRLAALAVSLVLLFLPSLFVQLAQNVNDPGTQQGDLAHQPLLNGSPAAFFLLWPAYGFAVAHLCGLLLRKTLVALVVSVGLSVLASAVWLPSLVMGDVRLWQVLLVPLTLMLAARWLLRLWATGRLASWPAARRLTVMLVLCAAMTFFGLWSRASEIPDAKVPDEFRDYVAALPDDNEAAWIGRDVLGVIDRRHVPWMLSPTRQAFAEKDDHAALNKWLDEVFADPVWERLERLRELPAGMIDDPRRMTFATPNYLDSSRTAAQLLAARGLQMQKKGKPEVFVTNLETGLALARNMRDPNWAALIERHLMEATNEWLTNLGNDQQRLLRPALQALRKHRESVRTKGADSRFAAYLIARNSLAEPGNFLTTATRDGRAEMPPAVIESALGLPWEKARLDRQVRFLYSGDPSQHAWLPSGDVSPPFRQASRFDVGWRNKITDTKPADNPRRWWRLDGMSQVVGLRLYQARTGKPAAKLDALVPGILPSLPADPFSGKPFGYRLSKGEKIALADEDVGGAAAGAGGPGGGAPQPGGAPPPGRGGRPGAPAPGGPVPVMPQAEDGPAGGAPPMGGAPGGPAQAEAKGLDVFAGQGVLWSVGEDRNDDGGKRQGPKDAVCQPGDDLIFVVPLPWRKLERLPQPDRE